MGNVESNGNLILMLEDLIQLEEMINNDLKLRKGE